MPTISFCDLIAKAVFQHQVNQHAIDDYKIFVYQEAVWAINDDEDDLRDARFVGMVEDGIESLKWRFDYTILGCPLPDDGDEEKLVIIDDDKA